MATDTYQDKTSVIITFHYLTSALRETDIADDKKNLTEFMDIQSAASKVRSSYSQKKHLLELQMLNFIPLQPLKALKYL